jgi:hypothetical protein
MPLIYQCPVTGMNVQHWIADAGSVTGNTDSYMSLSCPACAHQHFLNLATGRVLAWEGNKVRPR